MRNHLATALFAALLVGAAGPWGQGLAFAQDIMHAVAVKNENGVAANDLHLKFTGDITGHATLTDSQGKTYTDTAPKKNEATWKTDNCPTVPGDGSSVKITYQAPKGVNIDPDHKVSYWTDNGAIIDPPVKLLGQPPDLSFRADPLTGQLFGFATFFNPETVPVIYLNISFFINNDIANFNLDGFDNPTGQFVHGLPPQIAVGPGQSFGPLPLGPVDPSGYVLGFAFAATLADPSDAYGVKIAAVPSMSAQPIPVTGYNADVIADQDPSVRFAQPFDANTFAWFEFGAMDDNGVQHNDGLPAGLNFMSATGSGATYQIQPANGNNVLQLSAGQTNTLALTTPAAYNRLYFIASSGNGTPFSAASGNINFADGSTQVFTYNVFDWYNGQGGLHPEAVFPGPNGRADVGPNGTAFIYNRDADFQIYETVIPIDPWHAGVPMLSIDFTGAPDAFYSNIFGVSGQ